MKVVFLESKVEQPYDVYRLFSKDIEEKLQNLNQNELDSKSQATLDRMHAFEWQISWLQSSYSYLSEIEKIIHKMIEICEELLTAEESEKTFYFFNHSFHKKRKKISEIIDGNSGMMAPQASFHGIPHFLGSIPHKKENFPLGYLKGMKQGVNLYTGYRDVSKGWKEGSKKNIFILNNEQRSFSNDFYTIYVDNAVKKDSVFLYFYAKDREGSSTLEKVLYKGKTFILEENEQKRHPEFSYQLCPYRQSLILKEAVAHYFSEWEKGCKGEEKFETLCVKYAQDIWEENSIFHPARKEMHTKESVRQSKELLKNNAVEIQNVIIGEQEKMSLIKKEVHLLRKRCEKEENMREKTDFSHLFSVLEKSLSREINTVHHFKSS